MNLFLKTQTEMMELNVKALDESIARLVKTRNDKATQLARLGIEKPLVEIREVEQA